MPDSTNVYSFWPNKLYIQICIGGNYFLQSLICTTLFQDKCALILLMSHDYKYIGILAGENLSIKNNFE